MFADQLLMNNTVKSEILHKIEQESNKIGSLVTFKDKLEIQNNILQLKFAVSSQEFDSEIYVDLKKFIKFYLGSINEQASGYDHLSLEKLFEYFKKVSRYDRVQLLKFLIRELKISELEEYLEDCESELRKAELAHYFRPYNFRNSFRIIYILTTHNLLCVFISFMIIFSLAFVVLLPSPAFLFSSIHVEYHHFSNHFLWNHFLNVLCGPFGIIDDFKIVPQNFGGVILCLLGKVSIVLIIANLLVDQFLKKILP